jgi:2-polyprenyl-6-methoxyphenol hydroxylase-like FAD-dependent oxidoreductase
MPEHAVLIAGAGPTGLMLAGELALAGVDVAVFERRTDRDLVGSRAGGMTARTIEVLDQRGIAERFLSEGMIGQNGHYSGIFFDVSDLPTRHNYGLALLQYRIEKILAAWVTELGVAIHYGCEVSGFSQHATGVDVTLTDGTRRRGAYLVGCDGGRSLIRKASRIAFPGWDPSISCLVADVELTDEPPWGLHRDGGFHSFFKFDGEDTVRVMVTEPQIASTDDPTLADISTALIVSRGTDYGLRDATWISRFNDTTRQAATYRDRRVLLAGDAAHVHFPIGGQGLNTGIQDAVNLGWKLGQVVNETSTEKLLDTYHTERHPVAARVLHNTMAQTALNGPGERIDALRDTMSELLSMPHPREWIASMMCGLDIHYDFGEGHPILGHRMPDLDLNTAYGSTRLFTLLHNARGIVLTFGQPLPIDLARWAHRVSVVHADAAATWKLPLFGEVVAPSAVLVRPDGYVAWAGDSTVSGLGDALNKWFT